MANKIHRLNVEVGNAKSCETDLRKRVEDGQALIDTLRDQLKTYIDENKVLKSKPKVEYVERTDQTAVTELHRQIEIMQEERSKYQQLVARLEVGLEAKDEKLKNMEIKLDDMQTIHHGEISSLERSLAERNTIIDRILNLQKEQEHELSALKGKLSTAERGLLEDQHSMRQESQWIKQLQDDKSKYVVELQQADKRYKDLQDQLLEQQQHLQDFFSKESRDKERLVISLQSTIDKLQNENKIMKDEKSREIEKQLEMQKNINELSKHDSSKEVLWAEEKKVLRGQMDMLKNKLQDQENLISKLKADTVGDHQTASELEAMRHANISLRSDISNMKSTLSEYKSQNSELFSRMEDKNIEIKELVVFKERFESTKDEVIKLRSELSRRDEELAQFNSELVTLKDRIKNLLRKIDEVSNEKLFFEAKAENLETRLGQFLYDEKGRTLMPESVHLREEVQSKIIRAQAREQEIGEAIRRAPKRELQQHDTPQVREDDEVR